jgi:hypothetical protein
LVEEFHETDAQFQQVLLPEATYICSRARVNSEARCSEDIMTRRGDELSACDQEAHALQNIFARILSEQNFDEPIASRSPGYNTIMAVKIPSKSPPLSQSSSPQASSSSKLALIIAEVKLAAGATRATTCTAAVAAGCVAHRLAVGHAAGDALALAGVKLGLVVRLADLPPVVLRRMPWHGHGGRLVWWTSPCSQKGHLWSRGLISWEPFSGRAFSCPDL